MGATEARTTLNDCKKKKNIKGKCKKKKAIKMTF